MLLYLRKALAARGKDIYYFYTQELLHLKEMLLLWCQGEKTGGEV